VARQAQNHTLPCSGSMSAPVTGMCENWRRTVRVDVMHVIYVAAGCVGMRCAGCMVAADVISFCAFKKKGVMTWGQVSSKCVRFQLSQGSLLHGCRVAAGLQAPNQRLFRLHMPGFLHCLIMMACIE
jgi:hypothetical protein